jgi:hypothetical protein
VLQDSEESNYKQALKLKEEEQSNKKCKERRETKHNYEKSLYGYKNKCKGIAHIQYMRVTSTALPLKRNILLQGKPLLLSRTTLSVSDW